MKILQVINSLSAGGAESFLTNLAISQKHAGHEVAVFTYAGILDNKGKRLQSLLFENEIPFFSPSIKDNSRKYKVPEILRSLLVQLSPDIAHSHLEQSDLFLATSTIGLRNRPVLVRTIHNIFFPKSIPPIAHYWLSKRFDSSIACGDAVSTIYPYLGSRSTCIPNGIDLSQLELPQSSKLIRERLGIDRQSLFLINVGSFGLRNAVLQKAQDVILEALSQLKCSYKMVFLGDGELRKEMQERAAALGIGENCHFLGNVDNPMDFVGSSDLVIMPSRFEGLSIACIEAVCLGKPVLLSKIPAFECFQADSTIFVEKNSPDQLAVGINNYLSNSNFFNNRAESNRDEYRRIFSIERTAKRYLDTYQLHMRG